MKLGELQSGLAVGRRFWPQLAAHGRSLAAVLALCVCVAGLQILRPWPIKWILDGALVPTEPTERTALNFIWTGALAYFLLALLQSLFEYVVAIKTAEVGHAVTRSLRHRVFEHLTRLSPRFHARNKSGDLLMRLVGDMSLLRAMLVDASLELITRLLWVVGTVIVMFAIDAYLALILVATLPPLVLAVRFLARGIQVAVSKQRRKEGALANFLHEAISATETIQSMGGSDAVVHKFARSNRRSERAGLKAARLAARLSASVESMLALALALTLLVGGQQVLGGELAVGELIVFVSYVRGVLKPIRSASRNSAKIAKGAACGERILEILDEEILVRSPANAPPAPLRPRELVFEDVTFHYEDRSDALRGFSVCFRRGEFTGVFGRSGAGKSTMAALAVRLQDPEGGAIRLDGQDLRELDLQSVRDRFGLCLQDAVLFGDTIRENLLLAQPEATDEQLESACRAAGAAGFIEQQPEGLDVLLGTAGCGLSGGQRSRIALARTLLRRAPVLIVDEPFAGLDREAVELVSGTLRELAREVIVVVIAHDLEHLAQYDRVVFVDAGRVLATGTHAQLLESCGSYSQVVGRQREPVA